MASLRWGDSDIRINLCRVEIVEMKAHSFSPQDIGDGMNEGMDSYCCRIMTEK